MKTTTHLIGDRVSVRCTRRYPSYPCLHPGETAVSWLGGRIIGAELATSLPKGKRGGAARYVVQLDDDRRVVAWDDDVRRWTLAFEACETLEKMAS